MEINGVKLQTCHIPTQNTHVLILAAPKGFLACGYLKVETADKVGDACAIVTGVTNFDELLAAEVKFVSNAAKGFGVKIGMSGKDALLKMA
ncbi:MAG: YunC family protein [Bacteroidetes bacterium]|nr:YunC family protein [Bacteroidota bacterium]